MVDKGLHSKSVSKTWRKPTDKREDSKSLQSGVQKFPEGL